MATVAFRFFLLLVAALGVTAPATAAAESSPVILSPEEAVGAYQESPVATEIVPLHLEDRNRERVGKLTYRGGLVVKSSDQRFGGLSSLLVTPDGSQILMVSDNGYWTGATVNYKDGRLTGLRNLMIAPILGLKGEELIAAGKANADAEAITEIPGSGFVIAFEGQHRLWHYGANFSDYMMKKIPRPLPLPVDIAKAIEALPANTGIESLTTLADGSLVAIAEDTHRGGNSMPGWIIGETRVATFTYQTSDNFKPTDLTTMANGDLLILERRFTFLQGLAARIKRIKKADLRHGQTVVGEHIATLSYPYNVDNMEGIAVRENEAGETLVYIVSDDNYHPLQRTLLMMFRLDD